MWTQLCNYHSDQGTVTVYSYQTAPWTPIQSLSPRVRPSWLWHHRLPSTILYFIQIRATQSVILRVWLPPFSVVSVRLTHGVCAVAESWSTRFHSVIPRSENTPRFTCSPVNGVRTVSGLEPLRCFYWCCYKHFSECFCSTLCMYFCGMYIPQNGIAWPWDSCMLSLDIARQSSKVIHQFAFPPTV